MKYQYSTMPESMKKMETYGFSWMEFVLSIPSPLFIVTYYNYKQNPNSFKQARTSFNGNEKCF